MTQDRCTFDDYRRAYYNELYEYERSVDEYIDYVERVEEGRE